MFFQLSREMKMSQNKISRPKRKIKIRKLKFEMKTVQLQTQMIKMAISLNQKEVFDTLSISGM